MDSLTYSLFLIHLFDLSFFIFLWVVINFDLNQERGVEMFNRALEKDSSCLSFDWKAKRKPERVWNKLSSENLPRRWWRTASRTCRYKWRKMLEKGRKFGGDISLRELWPVCEERRVGFSSITSSFMGEVFMGWCGEPWNILELGDTKTEEVKLSLCQQG